MSSQPPGGDADAVRAADAAEGAGVSEVGLEVASRPDVLEWGTSVGARLEDLPLESCEGEEVSLHQVAAAQKLLWITVHADWCLPCAAQDPFLKGFAEEFGGRDVQVLFVLGEGSVAGSGVVSSETCRAYEGRFGHGCPVVKDQGFAVTEAIVKGRLPAQIVVDREAVIRTIEFGWDVSWQEDHFRQLLDELLAR